MIRSYLSNSSVCSNTAVVDAIAKELRKKAREFESAEKNDAVDQESVVSRRISGLKIRENEDRPLNLLDSANNWDQLADVSDEDDLSQSDAEFETSKDGRMILNGLEEESEKDVSDSDSEIDDRMETKSLAAKSTKTALTKKTAPSETLRKKRKTKSRDNQEENLISGSDYKASRAGGDVRIAGKPEPFAFLGFHKKLLNKRSKHQALRQYATIHHKNKESSHSNKKRRMRA
jgi:hypothetical protein